MTKARIEALELARDLPATPKNLDRVADRSSPEDSRWAFEQWALRKRARAKFARADDMLFTREALEQASHEAVAAHRASRFPAGAHVLDATCGIGADLIGLANRGPAMGFELDPERAACARWNLDVYGLEAEIVEGNCFDREWGDYAIADPARRQGGRRTLVMDEFEPHPQAVAERMQFLRLGCTKLSPLLDDHALRSLGQGVEFWSYGGECREAAIWAGCDASRGMQAVHIESGEAIESSEVAIPQRDLGAWFFEADPAAIRAHALARLGEQFGIGGLGDSNGYLTGNQRIDSPWLTAYRVHEEVSSDDREVGRRLRELGVRTAIVKSRVRGVDPARLSRQWSGKGNRDWIVAVYPDGKKVRRCLLEWVGPHSIPGAEKMP